jgi:hypothetical protein
MAKQINRNLKFSPDAQVGFNRGTGTDSSQALTMHKIMGRITSSTTNLGAKTTEAITLTNRHIEADSMVICQVAGGGAGDPVVGIVTPSAGSVVITVLNADPANACDAAYTIDFLVVGNASTIS